MPSVQCSRCKNPVDLKLIACPVCQTLVGYEGGTRVDYAQVRAQADAVRQASDPGVQAHPGEGEWEGFAVRKRRPVIRDPIAEARRPGAIAGGSLGGILGVVIALVQAEGAKHFGESPSGQPNPAVDSFTKGTDWAVLATVCIGGIVIGALLGAWAGAVLAAWRHRHDALPVTDDEPPPSLESLSGGMPRYNPRMAGLTPAALTGGLAGAVLPIVLTLTLFPGDELGDRKPFIVLMIAFLVPLCMMIGAGLGGWLGSIYWALSPRDTGPEGK